LKIQIRQIRGQVHFPEVPENEPDPFFNNNPYRFTDPDGRVACPNTAPGTCYLSDTYDKSKSGHENIQSTPSRDKVVVSMIPRMTTRGSGAEKQGFVVTKGGKDSAKLSPGSTASSGGRNAQVGGKLPANATVVVHSHPDGTASMNTVDVGLADSQPLYIAGVPHATINDGRAGIREMVDGQLQFRMVEGTLTEQEQVDVQQDINREQGLFQQQ
jgi:proteasome lid subunit RPN8/RPN11